MRARLGDVKDRACFAEMPVAFKLMIYAEILLSREVPMTEFNPLDETDILLACDRYCEAVNNLPDDDAWLDIVVKGTRWYSVLTGFKYVTTWLSKVGARIPPMSSPIPDVRY